MQKSSWKWGSLWRYEFENGDVVAKTQDGYWFYLAIEGSWTKLTEEEAAQHVDRWGGDVSEI